MLFRSVYLQEKKLQNAAMGKNFLRYFNIDGRVVLDGYHIVKTSLKEVSYKLDDISFKYTGHKKVDLTPKALFKKLTQGPAERGEVAAYCIQDCRLVFTLFSSLHTQLSMVEMSRVSRTSWKDIMTKGQQIKSFNLIVHEAYDKYVINDSVLKTIRTGTYTGAIVIDPRKGFYTENDGYGIVLDFASLYPSIIQEMNLCYSTLVLPDRRDTPTRLKKTLMDTHPDALRSCKINDSTEYVYAKPVCCEGILPKILVSLLSRRKQAKRDMKHATTDTLREIQNRRQLALKVTANSLYGFTGVKYGILPCKPIAATVTHRGRCLIDYTMQMIKDIQIGRAHV